MTDTFSSESTALGQPRRLIQIHHLPLSGWPGMQTFNFSDGCDENSRSMPEFCVLIGDYSGAENTFFSAHCFICILTGTINHVPCIQCWGRGFLPSALTEGESTNLPVRVDYTNISLYGLVGYSTETGFQTTADKQTACDKIFHYTHFWEINKTARYVQLYPDETPLYQQLDLSPTVQLWPWVAVSLQTCAVKHTEMHWKSSSTRFTFHGLVQP